MIFGDDFLTLFGSWQYNIMASTLKTTIPAIDDVADNNSDDKQPSHPHLPHLPRMPACLPSSNTATATATTTDSYTMR